MSRRTEVRVVFVHFSFCSMQDQAMAMLEKYTARAHPSASLSGRGSHVQPPFELSA